jgi:CBS domain-containing protein
MPGVNPDSEITRPVAYFDGSISRPVKDHSPRKSRPSEPVEARLELTDPAIRVVTDFVWEPPATVREESSIDDALREMIRAGVRALLTVHDDMVTGLIASYDIQGERPLQFLAVSGYHRHDEIEVRHIMTPWERVPTLDWQALGRARLSDLAAFFRSTQVTHVVVVEFAGAGETFVRGLVSRARLARHLGHSI